MNGVLELRWNWGYFVWKGVKFYKIFVEVLMSWKEKSFKDDFFFRDLKLYICFGEDIVCFLIIVVIYFIKRIFYYFEKVSYGVFFVDDYLGYVVGSCVM